MNDVLAKLEYRFFVVHGHSCILQCGQHVSGVSENGGWCWTQDYDVVEVDEVDNPLLLQSFENVAMILVHQRGIVDTPNGAP